MMVPTPTFDGFFRRLEVDFGVRIRPGPALPLHNADHAVILERVVGDLTLLRYVVCRLGTDRVAPDQIRWICEGLAINPAEFGIRPRGN